MSIPRAAALVVACAMSVAGCSSDSKTQDTAAGAGPKVEVGKPFPDERCAENKAAGPITYLSGYDFAASASIIDVLVAKQKGYFDAMCLDVRVTAGIASDNYSLISANTAQFASGGSFSELATYSLDQPKSGLVALAVEGRSAIDTLIVKKGAASTLADLKGAVIGVKKSLTASVQAMLNTAGLVGGTDYTTEVLAGFDPIVNIAQPDITGFTGFRSNEPGQLDRAGVAYTEFDPAAEGIPGSFGVLYTNRAFVDQHPTAATDFMRATMQGLADAVTDPGAAAMIAIDFIDNNGNPNHLSPESEAFRWQTESNIVAGTAKSGDPLGTPISAALKTEVEAYAKVGLFRGKVPDIDDMFDASILQTIYDDSGIVIWPQT